MNLIIFNMEMSKKSTILSHCVSWVEHLSKYFDKIFVITIKNNKYKSNKNIKIHSLKRENCSRLFSIYLLYKSLINIHKNNKINGYFIHMSPNFIPLLIPFKYLFNIKMALWYTHSSVPFLLKFSEIFVNKIFSVSNRSFNYKKRKVEFIGHGIDTNKYNLNKKNKNNYKTFSVIGRITPVKNIHLIIKHFLKVIKITKNKELMLKIIGNTLTEKDLRYFIKIKELIKKQDKYDQIIFTGNISPDEINKIYNTDFVISLCDGGLDKAIIEPMSMGIPIITSNQSAKELFHRLDNKGVFLIKKQNLYKKIIYIINNKPKINRTLIRNEIVENHSIKKLSKKISSFYTN